MNEKILYYAVKYHGDWKRIYQAITREEPYEEIKYEGSYITIVDEAYPPLLRRLQFAPWILFYEGNIRLCHQACVGMIGSRNASLFGMEMCKTIANELKKRYCIVSGLAKGIDACAHQCALTHQTIGVIGCGIDYVYPKENASLYREMKKNHLLISEYPNGCKPYAHHFPWRNRIIAALSQAIVVVEAKKRSGTLLTVNEALRLDIPIYCVPHDYMKENGTGCNLLISEGANILVDHEDIALI